MGIIDRLKMGYKAISNNFDLPKLEFKTTGWESIETAYGIPHEDLLKETPDEEPEINRKEILNNYKYGIPDADLILHDEVEDNGKTPEQSVKKYGIPEEQNILKYAVPKPEPTPVVTPEPTHIVRAMYGYPAEIFKPTPEPTPVVTPEPTVMPQPMPVYAHPVMPTPIVTPEPQPMPQPQPMPIRPSNPWRINVRNIFLNMFGGENSSFAQRVMNVFDNFFSRWR